MKKRKLFSIFVEAVLILSMLLANITVMAENNGTLQYIDESGKTQTVTETYTVLTSSDDEVTVTGVAYVEGAVTIKKLSFAQSDNSMLILGEGAKLIVTGALEFIGDFAITTVPDATAAELIVDTDEIVGISAMRGRDWNNLNIYAGKVTSTAGQCGMYIFGMLKTTGNASFTGKSRSIDVNVGSSMVISYGMCAYSMIAMDSSTIRGECDDLTTDKAAESDGIFLVGHGGQSALTVADNAVITGIGGDVYAVRDFAESYGMRCASIYYVNVTDKGKMEMHGGSATLERGTAVSAGIACDGTTKISGANVTAVGAAAGGVESTSYSYGLCLSATGSLSLDNATLTAYGDPTADDYSDIYSKNSGVEIGNKTNIYGKGSGAVCIKAKSLTVGKEDCDYDSYIKLAAGSEVSDTRGDNVLKVCTADNKKAVELLDEGCAFSNKDGEIIDGYSTTLPYNTIKVIEHTCAYDEAGRCKCGSYCTHTINASTGKCSICGKQMCVGVTKATKQGIYWTDSIDDALEFVKGSAESDNAVITLYDFAMLNSGVLPVGTYTIDTNGTALVPNPGRGMTVGEGTNVVFKNSNRMRNSIGGPTLDIDGGNVVADYATFGCVVRLMNGSLCVKNDAKFSTYFEVSGGNLEVYSGTFGNGIRVRAEGKTYKDYIVGLRAAFDIGNSEPIPYSEWSELTQRSSLCIKKCVHSFDEDNYCKYCNTTCAHKNGDSITVGEDGACTECGYQYYTAKVSEDGKTEFYQTVKEAVGAMATRKTFTLLTDVELHDDQVLKSGTYNLCAFKLTTATDKKITVNEGDSVAVRSELKNDEIIGCMGNNIQVNGKLSFDDIILGENVKLGSNGVLIGKGIVRTLDASGLINGRVRLSTGCRIENLIISSKMHYLDFIDDDCAFYGFNSEADDYSLLVNAASATEMVNVELKAHTCEFDTECICSCGRETVMPAVSYLNEYNDEVKVTKYKLVQSAESDVQWSDGCYVVKDNVEINGKIILRKRADIRLILCDGATLTVRGIGTEKNEVYDYLQSFTIYAQSKNYNRGKLISTGFTDDNINYGIQVYGDFVINGGDITATAAGLQSDGILQSYGVKSECGSLKVRNGAKLTAIGGDVNAKFPKNAWNVMHSTSSGIWLMTRKCEIKDASVSATAGSIIITGDGVDKLQVSSVGIYTSGLNVSGMSEVNVTAKNASMTRVDSQNSTESDYCRSLAVFAGNKVDISGGKFNLTCGNATVTGSNKAIREERELEALYNEPMSVSGGILNLTNAEIRVIEFLNGTTLRNVLMNDEYGIKTADGWHKIDSEITSLSEVMVKKLPIVDLYVTTDKSNYIFGDDVTLTAEVTLAENIEESELSYTWYNVTDTGRTKVEGETTSKLKITGIGVGEYSYLCVVETDGYEVAGNIAYTVSIGNVTDATVRQTNTLTYNGYEQTAMVSTNAETVNNAPVSFVYSIERDGTYTADVPGFKTAGEHTVYYKASAAQHNEASGSFVVKIEQALPIVTNRNQTTAKVRKGSRLKNAVITEGEILCIDGVTPLKGDFVWVSGNKTVKANGTEQMIFIPKDSNYASVLIDVEVSCYSTGNSGGGGGASPATYNVVFDTDGGSEITTQKIAKKSKAYEPKTPTKDGFEFGGWYSDKAFTAEFDFDTTITKNITLYAKWIEEKIQIPNDEQKPTTDEWKNPFTDVSEDDWFCNGVRYANENGLMSGVKNDVFAPNESITRGMLVTILYRAEGEPAVGKNIPFADVTADNYYANAVIWAQQNGIISGVSEMEFAPNENITREQIAAIIYRYAKFKGYNVTVGEDTNILSYTDFDEISKYAIESLQYVVGMGLLQGKTDSTLNPKDTATRAETAAILQRFAELNND